MTKITRAHIIAARARRDILNSRKKPVPSKIVKLADLDITKFPRSATIVVHGRHSTAEVDTWRITGAAGIMGAAETQSAAHSMASQIVSETRQPG